MISLNRLRNDNKSEINQNVSINVSNGDTSLKDIKVQYDVRDDVNKNDIHGGFSPDETVSNLILEFILKDLENHNGYILLSIDELKKVLKVLCKCDDVIIDVEPLTEIKCCLCDYDTSGMLSVKKILLKYNNKDCLENFKMHYNEIKILTEAYKVDITHVKSDSC